MPSQFDTIAGRYNDVKNTPIGTMLQATVNSIVGDVEGCRVLDLACGTGHHSRRFLERGAKEVVGLDQSEGMIAKARELSEGDKRLRFRVADCREPFDEGEFDLVLAALLLNYASNEKELLGMWQNIANSMKPGGRCAGVVPTPSAKGYPREYSKYGIDIKQLEPVEGGFIYKTSFMTDPLNTFETYFREESVFGKGAAKVGLCNLKWHTTTDPKDPRFDNQEYQQAPISSAFTATKRPSD
ncbi:hypothetical protein LOZ53_005543 [Ophidiomyces ophidiicola]|nr:hypothetical protein LOZ55_006390 [Ophidiomyces ophidiicola]KAI1984221.1 hypothetical protein LOZ53_005543 [Ophidiomyces ophidiicola]KAI1984797.1 hypothetical protein LOZ54_004420 [Ophidiomyces ophidiicola]KAI1985690.1 hypothetical protein LOZ51_006309 [Ophidiomyces ophidiicola]